MILLMGCQERHDHLCNPIHEDPTQFINEDSRFAIDLYLGNPSDATYKVNCTATLCRFPNISLPSYHKAKHLVANLSGIEPIVHAMCINSCIAYTGPFAELESCPKCQEPRYDQFCLEASSGTEKIPRQEFHTIPIGPQLQALYRNPESARHTHYLRKEIGRAHV